jgi:hypothetical protein
MAADEIVRCQSHPVVQRYVFVDRSVEHLDDAKYRVADVLSAMHHGAQHKTDIFRTIVEGSRL